MTKRTGQVDVSKLSIAELEAMSAEFDREFVADTFGPPPPRVRALLERVKRKRGRPRIGAGSKAISITIERSLLNEIDDLARQRRTPRAQLIANGIRAVLAAERAMSLARRRRTSRSRKSAGTTTKR